MPDDPRNLFNPEFLDAYDHGKSHWFLDALAENDVDDWTPVAPVRIYFGDDDVDVLPEEARRAEAAMKQRGADVTAISVGPCNHRASALRAIPQAIRWFTDLGQQRNRQVSSLSACRCRYEISISVLCRLTMICSNRRTEFQLGCENRLVCSTPRLTPVPEKNQGRICFPKTHLVIQSPENSSQTVSVRRIHTCRPLLG